MRNLLSSPGKVIVASLIAVAMVSIGWLLHPEVAQAQTCAPAPCMPVSVLVAPNLQGTTRPVDQGCYVWIRAWDEEILGGSVVPTSLIQPLRDVFFFGEFINVIPVVKAEKWAAAIVAAADGNKPWSDVGWMVFKDLALTAGARQVGDGLRVLGVTVTPASAWTNATTKAILTEITDALQASASFWRDWYMPAGWSWGDKQHCYASGYDAPDCYPSYADFRVAYPNISNYLDSAQVIRCTDAPTPGGGFSGTVTAATLNIRSGPGTSYEIVGKTQSGQRLQIEGTDVNGAWLKIKAPSGVTGWVSRQFVRTPSSCCPVVGLPRPGATPIPPIPLPATTPVPPQNLRPTETPTFLPTSLPPAAPAPSVSFYVDRNFINSGECTTLRWDVENAQAVFLNTTGSGESGVTGHSSQQVCPSVNADYTLRVIDRSGDNRWYSAHVDVGTAAPTPTFLPTILPAPQPLSNVSFYADNTYMMAGDCTVLRWDVDNVQAVFLGDAGVSGNGVAGHGSQEVCLNETRSYDLRVIFRDGSQQIYTITVTVDKPVNSVDNTYSVPANAGWTSTGLGVDANDDLEVAYQSGTWTISDGVDAWTDASGQPARYESCALMPDQPIGSLISRIGDRVFSVNLDHYWRPEVAGTVELSINDCPGLFGDNAGAVDAWVKIWFN